jgi:hypothetical protein
MDEGCAQAEKTSGTGLQVVFFHGGILMNGMAL